MSEPSSPKIHRPKPRRPYEQFNPSLSSQQSSSNLLQPSSYTEESISRTQSILNLTSSTLLGIYSPTGYQSDRDYDEPFTPWGTGAETPRTPPTSEPVSVPIRRPTAPSPRRFTASTAAAFLLRGILLFSIGMGYGVLVRRLHDDRQLAPFQVEDLIKPRNDWRYLVFWGVAGVCLGSLMPWVDTLFSSPIEVRDSSTGEGERVLIEKESEEESGILGADWISVVRSVGAFVGIAYAIRKLPWATPLQASLALFLVNPVLWYLIDRSAPGFILSSSVGAIGTSLLLISYPDMMPSPASSTSVRDSTFNSSMSQAGEGDIAGIMSRESFEMGIWTLSVLFCSCVCFGNVGRRLALSGGRRKSEVTTR